MEINMQDLPFFKQKNWQAACEETTSEGAEYFAQTLYDRGVRFEYVLDEGGMIMYEPIAGAKGTFAMIGMGERGCADFYETSCHEG